MSRVSERLPDFPWDHLTPYAETARSHPDGIVDLSVGTPVDATPDVVQAALRAAADAPGYPLTVGRADTREACLDWLARRFDGLDDDAATRGFHDPAEAVQADVRRLDARILHAIDREQHGFEHILDIDFGPRRWLVADMVNLLGDRIIALAKNDFNIEQHQCGILSRRATVANVSR